ncbi:MFS transporter [Photobacterium carnosum]|uniref:MFS transporter n=1 Tax=Photobacterium carnosum TaxID=2023717 RepID=UPI001E4B6AAF|nr:MFS transporter [Photobacterium carnosum]
MKTKLISILLPIICGLTVANMYYIQSIVPVVMKDINISYNMASMIYTISLIGNLTALIFITPLGDFIDRKKLISKLFVLLFLSNLALFFSTNIYIIYTCAYFLGFGICIIPITIAYLSTKPEFGIGFIGKIMSGVLLGALISRFLSSVFSSTWGWSSIYLFSSIMMLISSISINFLLPKDSKEPKLKSEFNYLKLILNTLIFLIKDKNVRRFSIYGFMIMVIFAAFWNNISIYLSQSYDFNQIDIGLFSLTGVAGATSAMFSNKILKKLNYNGEYLFIILSITFVGLIFIGKSIILFALASIIIDAMIQLTHVNNQANIYKDCKGNESRAASCYMTLFILGGIFGAKVSSYFYIKNGWISICVMCSIISVLCFISFLKFKKQKIA